MLERNIKLGWIVGALVFAVFLSLRFVVPGLMNMQNDGAMILAILVFGVTLTAPFIVYSKVIKPLLSNQEP